MNYLVRLLSEERTVIPASWACQSVSVIPIPPCLIHCAYWCCCCYKAEEVVVQSQSTEVIAIGL